MINKIKNLYNKLFSSWYFTIKLSIIWVGYMTFTYTGVFDVLLQVGVALFVFIIGILKKENQRN